ncbi:RmlC-like cupin domain-containing protein [Plectosphaerella plurivora]|uniref:RmlC-like cupin domain-containing protein n=1 Tax=Plectosphaerella plurivora TaxID=936078 RepID=A0A9P9A602_9PEZI|nr:RmlC-like cupin domain-containing protein [Plectosphaerella plurivora]
MSHPYIYPNIFNRNIAIPERPPTIRPLFNENRHVSDHGWLQSHASLSYANTRSLNQTNFSSLCVVNEDIVAPSSGFPNHSHGDFEIFTYVISGYLTHRDSISAGVDEHLTRGDVQFTTAGTGIRHSESNEHPNETLRFLQIWVKPWSTGLRPRYHTRRFDDAAKRRGFVKIVSPLAAGPRADTDAEALAQPAVPGSIPIHADFVMGAGLFVRGHGLSWTAGAGVAATTARKVFLHVVMGERVRVNIEVGTQILTLSGGDGAFVEGVAVGRDIRVTGVGEAEGEVVVLDMSE